MSVSVGDKDILVVGGAGFVGSNLVRLLLSAGARSITVVDNLLSSERDNLPMDSRIRFIEASIADNAVLAGLVGAFDLVFHLACYHGNQSSIHDPIADHDNNLITTLKLMNQLKDDRRVRKLVYAAAGCASAAKIEAGAIATNESAPLSLDQDSPYSISKLVGEFYAVYFHKRHGLPAVRARFQNVYGPGEVLGAGQWRGTPATVWRNVTPNFIWKSLNREALPLHNGGAGTRDFIFVDDICRGLIRCAEAGRPGEAYNLASGREMRIIDWAEAINRLTGNPTPCEVQPRRDWDTSGARFGSTEKSRTELGFSADTSAEEGLALTIAWTRHNRQRIEKCMAKHASHLALSAARA